MIDDVYRVVPEVACRGLCQGACGPIACSAVEADSMRDSGVNPPGVRAHPRHGEFTCSHLDDAGRCAVYEHRPLVCRLYGAVREMRCPHGCRPVGGFLPDAEARRLLRVLQERSGGREPHVAVAAPPGPGCPLAPAALRLRSRACC